MAERFDVEAFMKERLEWIENNKPLVHHITNYVVMNETANATLCMGASPVMAHAVEEVEEMAAQAAALILNMGTPYPDLEKAMLAAGKAANRAGVPVVFDPVGAGATSYRTRIARQLLDEVRFTAIRGNAAEMAVLAGVEAEIRGVDSLSVSGDVGEIAASLASTAACVAAVTGEVDVVSDGERTARVHNGHALLGRVTGTGCMATTAIAVFLASGKPYLEATAAGLALFGLAGEKAAGSSGRLPGSFHVELYNTLYELSMFRKLKGIKVELA
jgi:hydroxyethylthiazole kinase